jgi:hypothetical protein
MDFPGIMDEHLNEEDLEMEKKLHVSCYRAKKFPYITKNAKNNPLINCIIRGLWTYCPS